jgi:2'-5' RNA ligase
VRWVPPEQWHVTLRFLGDTDREAVAHALEASPLPRATAELGPVVSRFGRSTVVLPVAGLDELAAAVRAATAHVGPPPDPRPFAGHLTLARLRHRAACGVAGSRLRAAFDVLEVVLVDSELRPEGAIHRVVHRVATVATGNRAAGDLTSGGGAPRTPPTPPPR